MKKIHSGKKNGPPQDKPVCSSASEPKANKRKRVASAISLSKGKENHPPQDETSMTCNSASEPKTKKRKQMASTTSRSKIHSGKENHPPQNNISMTRNSASEPKAKRKQMVSTMYSPGTAANRLRIKRERKCKADVSEGGVKEYVDISSDEEKCYEEQDSLIVADIKLFQSDINILNSREWLNERLINAGQALMKKKFPCVSGLQDVGRSDTCTFQNNIGEFVQILNCHNSHWISITNKRCKPNEVKVYDSMCTGDVPLSTKEVIASIVKLSQAYIFLTFLSVQQQTGASECGLYSLAFSYTLCAGDDPAVLEYRESDFRSHFLRCLNENDIFPFPHSAVKKSSTKPFMLRKFRVYCSCRLPPTGDSMVQCGMCLEWFHFTCVDLQEGASLPEDWWCVSCKNKLSIH